MEYSEEFEQELAALTEEDAGFRNERDFWVRRGRTGYTLDDYRMHLRRRERDEQQMIDMGR